MGQGEHDSDRAIYRKAVLKMQKTKHFCYSTVFWSIFSHLQIQNTFRIEKVIWNGAQSQWLKDNQWTSEVFYILDVYHKQTFAVQGLSPCSEKSVCKAILFPVSSHTGITYPWFSVQLKMSTQRVAPGEALQHFCLSSYTSKKTTQIWLPEL